MLQAGQNHSKNLLWWSQGGDPKNPGLLSDVPWHRDRDHGVEVFGWKNGGFLAGFAQIW
jgi:hypothetical protein